MDVDSAEGEVGSARSFRSTADRLQEERTIHEALHRLQVRRAAVWGDVACSRRPCARHSPAKGAPAVPRMPTCFAR